MKKRKTNFIAFLDAVTALQEEDKQCRGRPPTKGASRDGPFRYKSWQSAVARQQLAVARNGPFFTCSVNAEIAQDRDNDRPGKKFKLPENRWKGRVISCCNQK